MKHQESNPKTEVYLHKTFEVVLYLKGIYAFCEIVAGTFILFATRNFIFDVVTYLTRGELSEEPHSVVANYLVNMANSFSVNAQYFTGAYIIFHGAIKLFLVICLLKDKAWAYGLSLVVFSIFIAYEIVHFLRTLSIVFLFLVILDTIVIWLTWHEYRYKNKLLDKPAH